MKTFIVLGLFLLSLAGNLRAQGISFSGTSSLQLNNSSVSTPDRPANDSISYYDLGGHLFTGQYPINNPFYAGDTGIIYLYTIKDDVVAPIDTTVFSNLGYFVFPHLREGTYLLKARLTEQSPSFPLFFPSYLTGALRWNSSDFLELVDKSIYEANIHMVPTSEKLSGPASLKGYVVQETAGQVFKTMGNTEVILLNDKLEPLTYCFSDRNGLFWFPNLPYGTYNLMAEATGKYPAILKITLDQHHTTIDSLLLETMMHNPATIEGQAAYQQGEISQVFPDPATERINLVVKSKEPQWFSFTIFAITGESILTVNQVINGISTVTLPVSKFPGGLYFIKIISEDGTIKMVRRWVKL